MLSYLRERGALGRTITVVKTRASRHDPEIRRFVIGPDGIVLDDAAAAAGTTLSGAALT